MEGKTFGSGGIRTHASEETGALNQRLRPLGHATLLPIEDIGALDIFPSPPEWKFLSVEHRNQHNVSTAIPRWTHKFSSDHLS